jgi:hypothetical protein
LLTATKPIRDINIAPTPYAAATIVGAVFKPQSKLATNSQTMNKEISIRNINVVVI